MLLPAIVAWVIVGIAFAFLGHLLSAGLIGLPSFLVLGVFGAVAGGWIGAWSAELLGGLLGAVLGALVGVSLVGVTAEVRTKGPTVSP